MQVKKVLFINTETLPYVPETDLSRMGKIVPEKVQSSGCEIRTFMPKWGIINERRGQLHEVIRLSGMNIIINGTDHPLIIKVASIPVSRVQVYFIDNDDYFTRRAIERDAEGQLFDDNAERAVFYARGVLETGRHHTALHTPGIQRRTMLQRRQNRDITLQPQYGRHNG